MAGRSRAPLGLALGPLLALAGCFSDTPPTASGGSGSASDASGSTSTSGGSSSSGGATASGSSGSGDASTSSGTSSGGVESSGDATTTATTTGLDPTTSGGDTTTSGGDTTTTGGDLLPIPDCDPLFFEDFSSDPIKTMTLNGAWKWSGQLGTLTVDSNETQNAAAWPTLLSSSDYEVHAYLRIESGAGNGTLRARFIPTPNPLSWSYYYLALRTAAPDTVRWGKLLQNQPSAFGSDQTAISPGEWHTVSLKAMADKLEFRLDGVLLGTQSDSALLNGLPAIGAYAGAVVTFDWFLVCAV